jgi:hypothetical protein
VTDRGRPKASDGILIGLRWKEQDLAAIDKWRRGQVGLPSRPEAIRLLVKMGLMKSAVQPRKQSGAERETSAAYAERAANAQIDRMHAASDQSGEAKAKQKRRLTKGPTEFRTSRSTAERE